MKRKPTPVHCRCVYDQLRCDGRGTVPQPKPDCPLGFGTDKEPHA